MDQTPGKRFGLVLGLVFTAIVAGALLVGAFVAYGLIKSGFEEQLDRRLQTYAATTASGISPVAVEAIRGPDDEVAKFYRKRMDVLKDSSGVRRVAILKRDGTFVVGTGNVQFGQLDAGFATDANELESSFRDGPVTTIAYRDDEGRLYRNGFAPVRHEDGAPSDYAVAVELEADYVDNLDAVGRTMGLTVAGVFVATLLAALGLARAWGRLQRALDQQTRLAEQAQFSAGMAHQIKNPLAALRGYVELLARGLDDPAQKQLSDKLVSEIGALNRIVRDFLQFSRGAHGSIERLTLESALRPVVESAKSAGGANVVVTTDLAQIKLEVDSTALREAMSNVAINASEALKEEGGELKIRGRVAGRMVVVEFADNGPGIPDDVRPKLFEPFVTGKADGTGLGLPIARRLLRDMGGELELIRSGVSGTMFRASFLKETD